MISAFENEVRHMKIAAFEQVQALECLMQSMIGAKFHAVTFFTQ